MDKDVIEFVPKTPMKTIERIRLELADKKGKDDLKNKIERLEAESDSKISYEYRKDIWRKIRLGLPLSDQEKMIHDYDLECFKLTGKWN